MSLRYSIRCSKGEAADGGALSEVCPGSCETEAGGAMSEYAKPDGFPVFERFGSFDEMRNLVDQLLLGELVTWLVEAWHTTSLDIEEVLSGVADSDVHLCS